jgi:Glycosyl transferase family 2
MWIELAFGGTAALFVATSISTLVDQGWVRRLPALPSGGSTSALVRCSVVVPARDEQDRIEATVRRLLAQQAVQIEVIVADDRSTDGTAAILERLAAEDARVRGVRIEHLPDGWLGKSHACHVAAGLAGGEWLLFTDADCWLKPDAIARALAVAARESADHVTLTPGMVGGSLGARAWHLAFLASLSSWIAGANRDRPRAYVGIGAFNLVRAAAYRQCGGYEALRLTVLDDVKLGLLLRRAGKRTRAFIGGDDVDCQWGTTVPGMFKVMEKNYFAAIDFKLAPVIAAAILGPVLIGTVAAGLWTGTTAGAAAGLAPLTLALPAAVFARRLGWPLRTAALTPFFYPVLIAAFLNSALVTLRQGGIFWRDTFYPLAVLRKGGVR